MEQAGNHQHLLDKIQELESRLEESDQLIDAIRAGEVDAFAILSNNSADVYTLQSGDYAFRVLIEQFEEGAINVTEDGLIVYANPYFPQLLQLPYEKVIGTYIADVIDPESIDTFNALFQAAIYGKSKGEINLRVHGTVIPVYISLASLQPQLATVGIIITDLTRRKAHEAEIDRYQNDLENKNAELLQSNAELASFAYIASHDLQEPLRKIQTFAARILEKDFETISEKGQDYFGRMRNAALRMQNLIEDLLAYSRTNTVERKYEQVELNIVLTDVTSELKEVIQQKGANITINSMCTANVILFQFRQLLQNLISNSLKFSKPDVAPAIYIQSHIISKSAIPNGGFLKDGNYCHISITDNGIGFDQQYSEKIFELFQRLHGRSEFEGTGIGLAIVKKIVDNHNGYITASSGVGEGATFDIYIPVL